MLDKVSNWEVAGVSMAGLFEALHALGTFTRFGVTDDQLIHLLVVAFAVSALGRAALDARKAKTE